MKKILMLCLFFTYKEMYSNTNELKHLPVKNNENIFIVHKKDKFESLSRFNYYTLNNKLIIDFTKKIEENNNKVFPILNSFFLTEKEDEIKDLAKLYNAEKIIILEPAYKFNSSLNVFSIFYLTVVGIFFSPGNNLSVDLDLNINVIDTKTSSSIYNASFRSSSSKYLYRLGNSQAVLHSAIEEVNFKILKKIE